MNYNLNFIYFKGLQNGRSTDKLYQFIAYKFEQTTKFLDEMKIFFD
jgi:hypothetical protein